MNMKYILLPIFFILSNLSTISAGEYADKYAAFSGVEPAPELKVLMDIELVNFSIDAKSFSSAMDSLRSIVHKKSKVGGLSMIIRSPDHPAYKKRIKIDRKTMKLADAIDLICRQAGVAWDFSGIKLTINPKK